MYSGKYRSSMWKTLLIWGNSGRAQTRSLLMSLLSCAHRTTIFFKSVFWNCTFIEKLGPLEKNAGLQEPASIFELLHLGSPMKSCFARPIRTQHTTGQTLSLSILMYIIAFSLATKKIRFQWSDGRRVTKFCGTVTKLWRFLLKAPLGTRIRRTHLREWPLWI